LVHLWCTFDVFLEHVCWCILMTLVVQFWITFHILWNNFAALFEYFWKTFRAILMHFWCIIVSFLVLFGTVLVHFEGTSTKWSSRAPKWGWNFGEEESVLS
jgi:hypothetical protein